jgi:threonine dehydrogenase-like Zn-dependent dehydrogenase
MKAISIVPHVAGISVVDRQEPRISAPDEVKLRVLQIGICGTDREEVNGGRADAPPGKKELVIGHEMFGRVVEVGSSVTAVKPGDYGAFTVRRGCGQCKACLNNRSDMCYTGRYTERGIKGADGYQTPYVVDKEQYLVKIPGKIKDIGVLTEPMSVAAKAIDEALIIQQARISGFDGEKNWLAGKWVMVAGLGPIGLLAAFALRLHGAQVLGLDVVDEDTLRPQLLKEIGGSYIDGRKLKPTDIDTNCGEMDFIFEATGVARLQVQLIDALAPNGIYVITGIPEAGRPITVMGGDIMQQLVLKNQVVLGSVNASLRHFSQAVAYLEQSMQQWPRAISRVITTRVPHTEFETALENHSPNEIKTVVQWADE